MQAVTHALSLTPAVRQSAEEENLFQSADEPLELSVDVALLIASHARLEGVPFTVLARISSPWRHACFLRARVEIREGIEEPFTFDLARRKRGVEAATWWQQVSGVCPEYKSPSAALRRAAWPDLPVLMPAFTRLRHTSSRGPTITADERLHLQVLRRQMETCRYNAFEQALDAWQRTEAQHRRYFSFLHTGARMLEAFRHASCTLGLEHCLLVEVPPLLGSFVALRKLDLSANYLTRIPREVRRLVSLQALTLASNQIDDVPDFLAELSELQSLDLSENLLTAWPSHAEKPPQLVDLKFGALGVMP